MSELQEQRDQLLRALKELKHVVDVIILQKNSVIASNPDFQRARSAFQATDAAIARAEGGGPWN